MSSEFEAINKRIAKLERRASLEKRSGTITDVDKDKGVRVDWGPGSDGKPLKSPWIKQSAHHGIIVEHKPFKVGQTVISHGMDPEHITSLVFPHSESDNNPADGNRSLTDHTYRIRKPNGNGKAKDDKDDLTYSRSYKNFHINVGEKLSRKISRDEKQIVDTVGKDDTAHVAEIQQDTGHKHSVSGGKHKITIHPTKGIEHSVANGDHSIKIDDTGITHTTKGSISKAAKGIITDVAKTILHKGNTAVIGNMGVSKLLLAVGGMKIGGAGIGAAMPGFQVDAFGKMTAVFQDYTDDVAAGNGGLSLNNVYRTGNVLRVLTGLGGPLDLGADLSLYALKASPAFTGTPTAPTPVSTDNSALLATTAFVQSNLSLLAPKASPSFTGAPTAPTQTGADNSTKLATTAFVQGSLSGLGLLAPKLNPIFTGLLTAADVTIAGAATAPTQAGADNSTKLATTAFVQGALSGLGLLAPKLNPTFTGLLTAGKLSLTDQISYNPVTNSAPGVVPGIFQQYAATGSIGTALSCAVNGINITEDSIAASGAPGPAGFVIQTINDYNFGGPTATGDRTVLFVNFNQTSHSESSHTYRDYVAAQGSVNSESGDGGGAGTEKGNYYGLWGTSSLGAAATHVESLQSLELDICVPAGASLLDKALLILAHINLGSNGVDTVQGSLHDANVFMFNATGNVGAKAGILLGRYDGFGSIGISPDGSVIQVANAATVAKGIDFGLLTISGNAWASPGAIQPTTIDGGGNIKANTLNIPSGNTYAWGAGIAEIGVATNMYFDNLVPGDFIFRTTGYVETNRIKANGAISQLSTVLSNAAAHWSPLYFGNAGTGVVSRLNRLLIGEASLSGGGIPASPQSRIDILLGADAAASSQLASGSAIGGLGLLGYSDTLAHRTWSGGASGGSQGVTGVADNNDTTAATTPIGAGVVGLAIRRATVNGLTLGGQFDASNRGIVTRATPFTGAPIPGVFDGVSSGSTYGAGFTAGWYGATGNATAAFYIGRGLTTVFDQGFLCFSDSLDPAQGAGGAGVFGAVARNQSLRWINSGGGTDCEFWGNAAGLNVNQSLSVNGAITAGAPGLVGDGSTNNNTAFQAALTAAQTNGGVIQLPPGTFKLTAIQTINLAAGKHLTIRGAGIGSTVLFFSGAGGLVVNYGDKNSSVSLVDFAITTDTAGTLTAITLGQTQSNVNPGYNAFSNLTNISIGGDTLGAHYFAIGVAVNNVSNITFVNTNVTGPAGGAYSITGAGVVLIGLPSSTTYAVAFEFIGCTFNLLDIGIQYGAYIQGVTVSGGCNFTGCHVGVYMPSSAGLASQLSVLCSQFNCDYCIYILKATSNTNIQGNTILVPAGGTGIVLAGLLSSIIGNSMAAISVHSGTAIQTVFITGEFCNVISGNQIASFSIGIAIGVSCSPSLVGNTYGNNSADISNASSAARIADFISGLGSLFSFNGPVAIDSGAFGASITKAIGFYGAATVAQRAAGNNAVVPAGGTGTAAGAWDTAAHRDAAIATINEIRTTLVNLGLMPAT